MTEQKDRPQPEPWLRGTYSHLMPVERAVVHSLEMAREDAAKWCAGLDDREFAAAAFHLPSPASQLRHIAGSLDRFLTYAEGRALSPEQLAALSAEREPRSREEVLREFTRGLDAAQRWIETNQGQSLDAPLKIGRRGLPTTLGGLLVHLAEHTQRHVGQLVTTVKLIVAQRAQGKETNN